jgi:hypothetical protein
VDKLLAEHLPEPLPEDVKAKLRRIVNRAILHPLVSLKI